MIKKELHYVGNIILIYQKICNTLTLNVDIVNKFVDKLRGIYRGSNSIRYLP